MKFTSPIGNHHEFHKGKSKGKSGRRKAFGVAASSLENTLFLLSAPSSKALKKSNLAR
jgi:hypothetical protein